MNDNELNELIERIRNRRLDLNYSYEDLSNLTGISKSTLQRYETGYIKKVPVQQIQILAKALGVTPSYLMGWEALPSWYFDPETAALAQVIKDSPDLRVMLDASKDLSYEDLKMVANVIQHLKKKERGEDD